MLKRTSTEKRIHIRFNKVFPVVVGSETYGDSLGVARNISAGGMMIEMVDPLPLGSVVTVHFAVPDGSGEIAARGEVKHHYCFNFTLDDAPASTRGIGLRFIEFLPDIEPALARKRDRDLH
jgi:hypothetical protein